MAIEANTHIYLVNTINSQVVINVPSMSFYRLWEKKGARKAIKFDILEQIIYDPSVEYLLKQGILYIEDMAVKKALFLEPEDAEEPVNITLLTEKEQERLLKEAGMKEFREKVETLTSEQQESLVHYAINNEIIDLAKSDFLKTITNRDIVKAIQLNREESKEE